MNTALIQFNPLVGDLDQNGNRILQLAKDAYDNGAELIVFSELALCGYPPEDLLLQDSFLQKCKKLSHDLASKLPHDALVIFGAPWLLNDLYNAAIVCHGGKIQGLYFKHYLPNYGVFDEERYFRQGDNPLIINYGEWKIGVCICEDMWQPTGPHTDMARSGADVLINLSASPYHQNKAQSRERMFQTRAADMMTYVLFCNQVGGQDGLLFDGASSIIGPNGNTRGRLGQFEEGILYNTLDALSLRALRLRDGRTRAWQERNTNNKISEINIQRNALTKTSSKNSALIEFLPNHQEVYQALQLGLRDYVDKNGFEKVLFGLSGGIDSAFVLALACDALGANRVEAITMPSQHTSDDTLSDAQILAEQKGVKLLTIPIKESYDAFDNSLGIMSDDKVLEGLAAENIQARIRGIMLMTVSNRFGHLVLAPGNKSELSVGYATLYGDTCGGFAPIADLWKTELYRLCEEISKERPDFLPKSIIKRPPTAELAPGQRDDKELPSYEILDPILKQHVELDAGRDELINAGHNSADVDKVIRLVRRAEFKRRQYPPGLRLSAKAFGKDRRLPITRGD